MSKTPPRFVFFGTPRFAVYVLEELKAAGLLPTLIVTAPDKPRGRGLAVQPPEVKVWAHENDIDVLQPEKVKEADFIGELANSEWDFFVVAAYGKILPKELLKIPHRGILNVHPSLLPKFRGASPIQSQILADEKHTGVSIMLIDEEMDHGPIVAQASIEPDPWPVSYPILEELLAREGGKLLAEVIPAWMGEEIIPEPQDHVAATFTKKIEKENGRIDLSDDAYANYLKFCAYNPWPGVFLFAEKNGTSIRLKVTEASFENNAFAIEKVIPEGKREITYEEFLKS